MHYSPAGTYTLTVDNALDLPAIVNKGAAYPATISIYGPDNNIVSSLTGADASVTATIRCAGLASWGSVLLLPKYRACCACALAVQCAAAAACNMV
jgi:hypothetical protein